MTFARNAIQTTDIDDNIEVDVNRSYSSFGVRIVRNNTSKRRLSNRVSVTIPDGRSESTFHLTIREARALRNFLNENLEQQTLDSSAMISMSMREAS
jgi:hypothetical protein